MDGEIKDLLSTKKIQYHRFEIIYDLIDHLKLIESDGKIMNQEISNKATGIAQVKKIFTIQKNGQQMRVLGCQVIQGKIIQLGKFQIQRKNEII